MEHNPHHSHGNHTKQEIRSGDQSILKLAIKATWHCLIGCGLGEVAGMAISSWAGLNNFNSIVISVILGFIGGMLLGILPLKKAGFSTGRAFRLVIMGEGLGIAVMEAFEIMTQVMIPGVMSAHLTDGLFWAGMIVSLLIGFLAALPVNYLMIKRGVRHVH